MGAFFLTIAFVVGIYLICRLGKHFANKRKDKKVDNKEDNSNVEKS